VTTIACDGHWLAADGLVTTDRKVIVEFSAVKVERLKDGSLLGYSGTYHAQEALKAFIEGATKEVESCGEFDAIRLMPDGTGLYYCEKHPTAGAPCSWPATLGTGGELALGAMLAGATPKQAVEIAAQRDTDSGGTIICLALEE
jgi:ATP-dependent protease HslVU (ClpYQ) peptidase subunit